MNHEQQAAAAFDEQSVIFDDLYSTDTIIRYKRQRVRDHAHRYLLPHSRILELNAGTGEDAIYFAGKGYRVHATDISAGMQQVLQEKVNALGFEKTITTELCSFTELDKLQKRGPYDMIFSNFAGLNCTGELDKVLLSFSPLLKPGGVITLVVLPPFCLWETAMLFKGKFKTAFRRFISSKGARAHIEGHYFTCWYYKPSYITRVLKDAYDLLSLEGLCTIVPPSYIENFAEKHPKWYHWLRQNEDLRKDQWPWKYIGDYYIISLKKN